MRYLITSLKSSGVFNFMQLLVVVIHGLLSASQALAASTAPPSTPATQLPLMFDARERVERQDLSTILRVRILTTVDFPPFNFADQSGRLSGFNIDLAREICTVLKIEAKCQIQAMPFADLEKTLEDGGGEAVMAAVAATPSLRQRFLFSRPYLGIPARFARNNAATLAATTVSDLSDRPVGVVKGTAHEAMLRAFFPKLTQKSFDSYEDMLAALKERQVDAVFADGLRLPFWVASEASETCCSLFDGPYLSQKFLGEGLTIMVRRNDPTLAAAFDQALAELSRNGRLQELYLRYFPNGLY